MTNHRGSNEQPELGLSRSRMDASQDHQHCHAAGEATEAMMVRGEPEAEPQRVATTPVRWSPNDMSTLVLQDDSSPAPFCIDNKSTASSTSSSVATATPTETELRDDDEIVENPQLLAFPFSLRSQASSENTTQPSAASIANQEILVSSGGDGGDIIDMNSNGSIQNEGAVSSAAGASAVTMAPSSTSDQLLVEVDCKGEPLSTSLSAGNHKYQDHLNFCRPIFQDGADDGLVVIVNRFLERFCFQQIDVVNGLVVSTQTLSVDKARDMVQQALFNHSAGSIESSRRPTTSETTPGSTTNSTHATAGSTTMDNDAMAPGIEVALAPDQGSAVSSLEKCRTAATTSRSHLGTDGASLTNATGKKMVVNLDSEEGSGHRPYQENLKRFAQLFQQSSDHTAILDYFIQHFTFQRDDLNNASNQEPLTLDEASARGMLKQALLATSLSTGAAVHVATSTTATTAAAAVETAAAIASLNLVQNAPKEAPLWSPNESLPPPRPPDSVTTDDANAAAAPECRRRSTRERRPSRRSALAADDDESAARLAAQQPMSEVEKAAAAKIVFINRSKGPGNAKYKDELQAAVVSYQGNASNKPQQDMIVENIAQKFEFRHVVNIYTPWQLVSDEAVRLQIHGALASLITTRSTDEAAARAAATPDTATFTSAATKKIHSRLQIPKEDIPSKATIATGAAAACDATGHVSKEAGVDPLVVKEKIRHAFCCADTSSPRDKDDVLAKPALSNIAGGPIEKPKHGRVESAHGPDGQQNQGQSNVHVADTALEMNSSHQIILPPFDPAILDSSWTDETVEQLAVSFRSTCEDSDDESDVDSDDDLLAEDAVLPPAEELANPELHVASPSYPTPRTKSELNTGTSKTGKLVVYCSAGHGRQDGNKLLVARVNADREVYVAANSVERERLVASILEDFNFQQPATTTDLWVPACAARTTDIVELALAGNSWEKLLTQATTEQVKPLGSPGPKSSGTWKHDPTSHSIGTLAKGALTTSPQRVSKVVVMLGTSQGSVEYKAAIWAHCESYHKAIAREDKEQQNRIVDSLAKRFDFQQRNVTLNEWQAVDPDVVRRTITMALEPGQQWKPIYTTPFDASTEDDDPSLASDRDLDTAVSDWLDRRARTKAFCRPFLPPTQWNAANNPSNITASTSGPDPLLIPTSTKRNDPSLCGLAADVAIEPVHAVYSSRPVVYCGSTCSTSNDKQPGNIAYKMVLMATQYKYRQGQISQAALEDAIAIQFQFVRQSSLGGWEPAPQEVIRKKIQNALHYLGRSKGTYGMNMPCDDGTARIVAQVHADLAHKLPHTTQGQHNTSRPKELPAPTPILLASVTQTVTPSNETEEKPIVQCGPGFQILPGNVAYFQYIASIHDQYRAAAGNITERELILNMVRERFVFERNGQPEAEELVRKKILKALRNERYGKLSPHFQTVSSVPMHLRKSPPSSRPTTGNNGSVPLHLRKPPPPSRPTDTTSHIAAPHQVKARKAKSLAVAKKIRVSQAQAATPHRKQVVHCGQGFKSLAGNVAYLEHIASIQEEYTAAKAAAGTSDNNREGIINSVLARFDFYKDGKRADEDFCRNKVMNALGNKRYGSYTAKKRPADEALGETEMLKQRCTKQARRVSFIEKGDRKRAAKPADHVGTSMTPASTRPQNVRNFLNEIIVIK